MKALVYLDPGKKGLEDRPKPEIAVATDAIVKITKTTICGTDLHILKGDVPSCEPGRILGHEGIGIIDQVGSAVTAFKPGDRVRYRDSERTVAGVDRRRVYFIGQYADMDVDASDVEMIPPTSSDDTQNVALRSLTQRWRALTDELLTTLQRLVESGLSLNGVAVNFDADADVAFAQVWYTEATDQGAMAPRVVGECTVRLTIHIKQ